MNNTASLKREIELTSKLYYKSKNQFKSSIILSRLNEVRKRGKIFLKNNTIKNKELLQCSCINLYISASSNYTLGHFIKFSIVLFGISSRIYTSVQCFSETIDEIDDIFEDL
ncbi:uncharacterized protein VNE69_09065 [Vairimorpha necatrix]|uniref:Uncharacterized protein n=1 Tax=Vairimorpha necatrix TaxID=6039 RepID=A0AAX4JET6_9MICR